MNKSTRPQILLLALLAFVASSCSPREDRSIVGAWKGKVQFTSGAFAEVRDLEFMYVFNKGGTMTESSNYDGAPPVPPAYGVWKRTGRKQFEARYEFFTTKPPAGYDDIAKGGGWMPAGHGVLMERITLSKDGRSFSSTITLELFDREGKPVDGGGDAEVNAIRMRFKE